MTKDEDLENKIHRYHKLLEEGRISADEFQKLIAKEEKTKLKLKKPKFSRKLRNFLIGALIFGTGFLIYNARQPKLSKDAEKELRQTIAGEIDKHGAGYFLMPKGAKGIDYDGKKYTIDFHDNLGEKIDDDEFIMPMSVEKKGRIYWYDIRIKDDEFVSMKRKRFTVGGGCGCSKWWREYRQNLKPKEEWHWFKPKTSEDEKWFDEIEAKKAREKEARAKLEEEKRAKEERRKQIEATKYTSKEITKLIRERGEEVGRYYGYYNLDNKKDRVILLKRRKKGWIQYELAFIYSANNKYRVKLYETFKIDPRKTKTNSVRLIFDKRFFPYNSRKKMLDKLFIEGSQCYYLKADRLECNSDFLNHIEALSYCASKVYSGYYKDPDATKPIHIVDTISFFYDTKNKEFCRFDHTFYP